MKFEINIVFVEAKSNPYLEFLIFLNPRWRRDNICNQPIFMKFDENVLSEAKHLNFHCHKSKMAAAPSWKSKICNNF